MTQSASESALARPPKSVLVVDDSLMIRRIVGQILQECGYRVMLAGDGHQGYESARTQQPDLVLMDLQMPGLDGFEAIHLLKKDPLTSSIPVLILTSVGSEDDMHRAREAGCLGFMNKPICKKELTQSIATILNGGS